MTSEASIEGVADGVPGSKPGLSLSVRTAYDPFDADVWAEVLGDLRREDRLLRMDDESPETLRDADYDPDPMLSPEEVRFDL